MNTNPKNPSQLGNAYSPLNNVWQQPDAEVGTPESDAAYMDGAQSYDDTCAIKCQEYIIQMFTGLDIPEDQLVQDAIDYGWYAPGGGTTINDMGNLLELYGVPVNRFEESNIYHLANELAQGHKVMIAVDSGELWETDGFFDSIKDKLGFDEGADHAVVVSGIDTSDPDNPMVIVSDPGTGETAARYPMDQFLDAWEDSNFTMVSTQDPAPHSAPGMEYFPYDQGYIPTVLDMPYEEFAGYEPSEWMSWFDDMYTADPLFDPTTYYGIGASAESPDADHAGAVGAADGEAQLGSWSGDYCRWMGDMALDSAEYAASMGDYDSAIYYSGVAIDDYEDAAWYDWADDFYGYDDSYDSYYDTSYDDSYYDTSYADGYYDSSYDDGYYDSSYDSSYDDSYYDSSYDDGGYY